MSRAEEINYPPQEVHKPVYPNKKNFEHIILWMLKNNNNVEWSHFTNNPVNISQGSLSKYINKLYNQGYIEKISRGTYHITEEGEARYNELSQETIKKRKLSYPPKAITGKRNWDHVILWMVYNNNYCKWSDFLEPPLSINQSSLSKNLNLLMDNNLVKKENKEYSITQAGKSEYSEMLKFYDLDRQSILDEESKRIKEFTRKTVDFFDKYGIEDDDIKFRFLNNLLRLSYARVKTMLKNEEDFDKILLFLSINHPDQYPTHIKPSDFAKKFEIKQVTLEYYIEEIIENNIYPIKFFKLEVPKDEQYYYFQADEYLEKMLRAKVDNYITKYTYLKRLYNDNKKKNPTLNKENLIETILEDICANLFNSNLKDQLKAFLPSYIKYLAYKVETERRLINELDKFEGIAWQNISEVFQTNQQDGFCQKCVSDYHLDPLILEIIISEYKSRIPAIYKKIQPFLEKKDFTKVLKQVDSALKSDQETIEILILKAIILCYINRNEDAIEFLENEMDPSDESNEEHIYTASNFILAFSYMTQGNIEKALDISNDLLDNYPDNPLASALRGAILGYNIIYKIDEDKADDDTAFDDIDKAISLEQNNHNKAKYNQLKANILQYLERDEDALDAIDNALIYNPDQHDLYHTKIRILSSMNMFDEAIELADMKMKEFPDKKEFFIDKIKSLKKLGRREEGLDLIDNLLKENPEDFGLLNYKAYWLASLNKREEAIEAIQKAIELDPTNGNYFDSYGEILMGFEEYEEAVEQFKKAIELDPHGWYTYQTYTKMGESYKILGDYDAAEENLTQGKLSTNSCFCEFDTKKKWADYSQELLDEIKELKKK